MNKFVLTAAMAAVLGLSATAAMAEHHEGGAHDKGKMMERIDTDGDGVVSKAEFMAKHEEKFTKMDKNSDGNLSKEEMESAREAMKEKWKDMKDKVKGAPEEAAE